MSKREEERLRCNSLKELVVDKVASRLDRGIINLNQSYLLLIISIGTLILRRNNKEFSLIVMISWKNSFYYMENMKKMRIKCKNRPSILCQKLFRSKILWPIKSKLTQTVVLVRIFCTWLTIRIHKSNPCLINKSKFLKKTS